MIPKVRPTPPGEFIKEDILNELGLTQEQLAKSLGVSKKTINQLINEKRKVTADVALRLGKFTDTSPKLWLNLQIAVDLWDAFHTSISKDINHIQPYTLSHDVGAYSGIKTAKKTAVCKRGQANKILH